MGRATRYVESDSYQPQSLKRARLVSSGRCEMVSQSAEEAELTTGISILPEERRDSSGVNVRSRRSRRGRGSRTGGSGRDACSLRRSSSGRRRHRPRRCLGLGRRRGRRVPLSRGWRQNHGFRRRWTRTARRRRCSGRRVHHGCKTARIEWVLRVRHDLGVLDPPLLCLLLVHGPTTGGSSLHRVRIRVRCGHGECAPVLGCVDGEGVGHGGEGEERGGEEGRGCEHAGRGAELCGSGRRGAGRKEVRAASHVTDGGKAQKGSARTRGETRRKDAEHEQELLSA